VAKRREISSWKRRAQGHNAALCSESFESCC